jgi:hypothetical protein
MGTHAQLGLPVVKHLLLEKKTAYPPTPTVAIAVAPWFLTYPLHTSNQSAVGLYWNDGGYILI